MSIYQRSSDKLWVCSWYENGKKKTKTSKDKAILEQFEAKRLGSAMETEDRLTLGELTIQFFRSHPDYHSKTRETVIRLLSGRDENGKHITGEAEFIRDKYADSLTRRDLETIRQNFWGNPKKLKDGALKRTSNKSINHYQAYISAILKWGAEQDLISRHPWKDYRRLPETKKETSASLDRVRLVYDHSPPWLQWAIKTAYALVLRPGQSELFALMWDAFDWRNNCVHIRQGKGGRLKTVYPPPYYMHEAYERFQADSANGIPLVCHRDGKRVLTYAKAWAKAIQDAGLEHFRMYVVRHTAISEALSRTGDPAAVAKQAGHAYVSTTVDNYAHALSGAQQRVAAIMPALNPGKDDESE